MKVRFLMLVSGLVAAAPASAGSWTESPLGKAKLGEVWNSQSVDQADWAGRVVLINTWSDGSESCRKAMPGLASYEKKMRGSGLVVLGVARKSTKEAALEVARQSGVDFPIIDGGMLPGVDEKKIPQYTVYDHHGEIVFKQTEPSGEEGGLSPQTQMAIDKALSRAAPTLSITVEDFQEKEIIKFAKRANKGSGLGKLLSDLDGKIAGGTEAERGEAERLRDQIIGYGERVMEDAEAAREERPHRHFDMMKDLAKEFRGHDLGIRAESALQSVRSDRAAMREVEASRLYEELSLAPEKDKKKIYGTLKKKYADSRFAKQAADEMGDEAPVDQPPQSGQPDPKEKGDNDDADDD